MSKYIAISWADNTGKSNRIRALKQELEKHWTVRVLEEIARNYLHLEWDERQDAILKEEWERYYNLYKRNYTEDYVLIDRTVSDTLFYTNYGVSKWVLSNFKAWYDTNVYDKVFLLSERVKETNTDYYFCWQDFVDSFNKYIINKYSPILIPETDREERLDLILKNLIIR